jgi:flagellar biosynthetic protein FlhB
MAEQEQDRSEQATTYKVSKAREKGMVPRSAEVNTAFAVAAFLAFLSFWAGSSARRFGAMAVTLLQNAHAFALGSVASFNGQRVSLLDTLATIGPLLGLLVVAALSSAMLQFGLIFTAQPLKPDWQRLNPMEGFKRIFSKRALFETIKNVLKLILFSGVLYLILIGLLNGFLGLSFMPAKSYGPYLLHVAARTVLYLLMALIVVAVIDMLFARREYARKLMMSRREIKDEVKHREGDPKIKARIRELQNELRKKSLALKNVPGADVLITNPTHIAIALSYRHGEMPAPQIVAKGTGELVEAMKDLARRHGVPIVENRPLARALYRYKLLSTVPEAHYAAVARILIWVQEARRLRAALPPIPTSSTP